ncbi:MAG: fumarylacetoacetate hydrolase family protein [Alphaproteobacteria bacterium]|nr:fumarylacetoacetate hydrolase family protein [Alphaproteobacteria bacterium]
MRLMTYGLPEGGERPAVVVGEAAVDLNDALSAFHRTTDAPPPASIEALLAGGADALRAADDAAAWAAAERPDLTRPLADLAFAPPVTRPEKIIGVGLNYRDHCAEIGRDIPTGIQTFGMFANSLVGHGAPIRLNRESAMPDWEAELVIVIGTAGKHIPEARAMEHVAGFTIGNDVSARDFQKADPQAMRGKSGDANSPLGPWIVTRDELPDDSDLAISLSVNGETKQASNTRERVFQTPAIVSFLSRFFTLKPGDLIFTGTPGGVGMGRDPQEWLQPGDQVSITVAGIGVLSNPCEREP